MNQMIEGVWTAEVYGPFGWDSIGILILEHGRIIGGGNRHYSAGTYELADDKVTAVIEVHYYGPPRTMWGETAESFTSQLAGKLKDKVIEGVMTRHPDKGHHELMVRLTRRMDIPAQD